MISVHRSLVTVLILLAATAPSFAQTTSLLIPPGNRWSHGTTLNVFGGGAVSAKDNAPAAGGAFGWELTPRFALEGSGAWIDWGQPSHAFTATMTAHVAVLTPRPLVPFLAAGMGVYHASFNAIGANMPSFYRRRLPDLAFAAGQTMAFTDPSLVGGGGIEMFLSRHWTIRPEVMTNVVMRDSRRFVATTGVVRLAYHFEDHPITPAVNNSSAR